ncbi:MAG: NTP/NDP exchange transporter [Deltaproteobacteria bacterium]|nr:NTP/NDP exchange transporter [Deltaproteobacteria bacterium]
MSSLLSPALRYLSQIQKLLIPVRIHELGKFLPTFLIFFLLAYIYDMLRLIKSSIVVATSHVGAEIIPFLKVWALIPGAVLLASLAIRLSARYSREKVFYLMQSFFILFYILFMVLIYPNRDSLELNVFSDYLMQQLPPGMGGLASMFQFWYLTIFYVITELWGSILLSMLFWGFANEITSVEQAGRFYPLFLLGANSAAIFAGHTSAFFADHIYNPAIPFGHSAWEQSLVFYLSSAVLGGGIVMALFRWMHTSGMVDVDEDFRASGTAGPEGGKAPGSPAKVTLSFRESVNFLLRSRHLMFIAMTVLSYNMIFNLSDVLWENQLKSHFSNDIRGMTYYRSHVTIYTGVISVFISLFVTGNILRRLGWKYAAILTPFLIIISGIGFFSFLLIGHFASVEDLFSGIAADPLGLALLFGSIQICVSRGSKYTLFDTTKEIAFIPLERQAKRYGKAAIDGVGSRLGKSAGSMVVQLLLLFCGSISSATPYMIVIIFLMLFVWVIAVRNLGRVLN